MHIKLRANSVLIQKIMNQILVENKTLEQIAEQHGLTVYELTALLYRSPVFLKNVKLQNRSYPNPHSFSRSRRFRGVANFNTFSTKTRG